jgi:phosphatidylglycerol:prolipoprotein diacylglycerol transferase
MRPILFDFGTLRLFGLSLPLRFYGYGVTLVVGFLLGIHLAQRRAARAGEDRERVSHLGLLALIAGILGARIAYVIENHRHFAHAGLGELLNITSGGLIYYGGVVLAVLAMLAYLRWRKLPVRRFLDIIAPSLMIGLAFGRAGCTLNGCCFGARCRADWPLAMRFPMYAAPLLKFDGRQGPYSRGTTGPPPVYAAQMRPDPQTHRAALQPPQELLDADGRLIPPSEFTAEQVRAARGAWSLPVRPAQPLGIINALLLAGLLTAFYRLRTREGQVFVLMLILYPITRFLLEVIRDPDGHSLLAGRLTHNQYTSAALVAVGVILWLLLRRLPASAGPTLAARLAASKRRASGGRGRNVKRASRHKKERN